MIPKVEACAEAVRAGVGRAHILDGRVTARAAARALHRLGGRHDGAAVSSTNTERLPSDDGRSRAGVDWTAP